VRLGAPSYSFACGQLAGGSSGADPPMAAANEPERREAEAQQAKVAGSGVAAAPPLGILGSTLKNGT